MPIRIVVKLASFGCGIVVPQPEPIERIGEIGGCCGVSAGGYARGPAQQGGRSRGKGFPGLSAAAPTRLRRFLNGPARDGFDGRTEELPDCAFSC